MLARPFIAAPDGRSRDPDMPTAVPPITLRDLYLLRHGETEGESSIRYHGVNDVPLSDLGREQMRAAAARMAPVEIAAVVSSPLSRALEGARLAAADRGLPVRIEQDFREIDFGRWEGLTREEIRADDPDLYAEWMRGQPDFRFPDGETRDAFERRVASGLRRLLELAVPSALVVGHKGVIRAIVRGLCGDTLTPGAPELGELLHVSVHAGRWALVSLP